MLIERDIHPTGAVPPRIRERCLICEHCPGPCWHLRELQTLPGTILRDTSHPVDDPRR